MPLFLFSGVRSAGETLKEIHETVEGVLRENYIISLKGAAIRVWDDTGATDFHIDILPG